MLTIINIVPDLRHVPLYSKIAHSGDCFFNYAQEFLEKFENNQMFKVYRTRVRTRLHGPQACFKPIRNSVTHDVATKKLAKIITQILPERGLNEVFVGELDSTEPSFLEIEVNKSGAKQRIKCSGKV